MNRKAVVFLQNAWSPFYAGRTWPRKSWLAALHRSRSGQRLAVLAKNCPDVELWYDNTTPVVGDSPKSIIAADFKHMKRVIREQDPDFIVTCGKLAAQAVAEAGLAFRQWMKLPHPAYRVLTNSLYEAAGAMLEAGFIGIAELEQEREHIRVTYPGRITLPTRISPTQIREKLVSLGVSA